MHGTRARAKPLRRRIVCLEDGQGGSYLFVRGISTFRDLGQANLTGNQASVSIQYQKLGTYPLQAVYLGDANNGARTSLTFDEYVKVLPVPTKTTLATSGSPSEVSQSVTFTATVKSDFGTIPNTEPVTFFGFRHCSISNGVATLTTSFSKAKTYTIKAAYAGDDAFKSSSGIVKQVVNQ